ncbi:hypothetical protein BU25DRAFT_405227 [Macroventuria anomochaeta]|uniref:Uncharacterized protein n=1 Tax=Macroventuria anomochaeta TaxID=301207 RepID=A0ACB6SH94_9PLEO|nr:uncharacterized protein BU25DRAFT_405227 [Macroventuria anomochaeta]KAF2633317.1 hypothetical protein BU25DRAFT_405227 [Macroventuria anomochaeta]
MSQPPRATNGTGSAAGDSHSHYTLVSHTKTKTPLQQTDISTLSTSRKKTTMDQATPNLSPFSSVPDSPRLSAKDGISHFPVQSSSTSRGQPGPETNDDNLPVSRATLPGISPAATLETTEDRATKRPFKRTRAEEDDHEGSSPVPKKPTREAERKAVKTAPRNTEAPNETTVDDHVHTLAEDGVSSADKLTKPEKSVKKSKIRSKTGPKKPAATSKLGRACDTCKRRKVKCKHRLVEEGTGDEDYPPKKPSLKGGMDEAKKKTNPTQIDEEDGLADTGASEPKQAVTQVGGTDHLDVPIEQESTKKSKAKKKDVPKKARAPPERTSTRNRKAPERFEVVEEKPPAKASPGKKGASKVFDPVYITTNSTGRLGKADMYHMLLEDEAWTNLSAEQQATLVSMLPDTAETQQLLAKIKAGETEDTRPQIFKANVCFRTEVAKFQADLTNGHLAKTWQAVAEQAVIERAAGEYDAWKAEEAELWWGQKSK